MSLETKVLEFGQEIFSSISRAEPSLLHKKYWASKLMQWSMDVPECKVNLFRLVDVLPALPSNRSVIEHVEEYILPVAEHLGTLASSLVAVGSTQALSFLSAPMVRRGVREMSNMFIAGETPKHALPALNKIRNQGMAFTVDLLGEFCLSEQEALHYLNRYLDLLDTLENNFSNKKTSAPIIENHPGEAAPICISVKLTALYSQTSVLNMKNSVAILSKRLAQIVTKARTISASVYVDAEDCANNPVIYKVFDNLFSSSEFRDFPYPGIVLQGYTKDSEDRLHSLLDLAKRRANPIAIRLVKGAYWDSETIAARQNHWPSPLFTHKQSTDAHYERLTEILLNNADLCLPAFGSHNVRSLSYACCLAQEKGLSNKDFELQMLYGMAEPIAQAFRDKGYLSRFYVPVGDLFVGMGYLVRRLLENTSNESFLKHTFFDSKQINELLTKPLYQESLTNL